MAVKALSGFLDNGRGEPLADIPAVATILGTSTVVDTTMTDANGEWLFAGLPTANEYLITLSDSSGAAVSRAPWSGEMRELWVRDRLDVAGLPLTLDPAAGNSLAWTATGLYVPPGITLAAADTRYVNILGDTMTGDLTLNASLAVNGSSLTVAGMSLFDGDVTLFRGLAVALGIDASGPVVVHDTLSVASKPVIVSPTAGNTLTWDATGLYSAGGLTQAAADLRYEPIDTMYTKAEADARYPQKTDVDPYPNYLTSTEADALFLTPAEGNAAYATAAHNHDTTYVQLTGGSVMTGLLGPSTHNTRDLGTTGTRWRALYGMTGDFTTSLTVATKPITPSPDAANIIEFRANGLYAAAGAVTDIWVNTTGDTMTGDLNMTANVLPTVTNVRSLGSTSLRWLKVWATDADFTNAPTVGGAALLTSTTADALFLTPAEGNAAYATAAHNHDTTYVQLTGGSVMTGLLGPTTNNTRDLGTTALRWRKLWAVDGEFTNAPTVAGAALLTATAADALFLTPAEGNAAYVSLHGSTMDGELWLTMGQPTLAMWEGDSAVNNRQLKIYMPSNDGRLRIAAHDDAGVEGTNTLEVRRSANQITTLTPSVTNTLDLGTSALRWKKLWGVDADLSGVLGVTGAVTLTAGLTVGTTLSVNSRPVIMAGCRVTHNAAQSITTNTLTALAFNTERYDTDAFHDTVTNNTRLTVPAGLAGKYLIFGNADWQANADANERTLAIRLNGATYLVFNSMPSINSASVTPRQPVTTIYDLAVGDYVELIVRQQSGTTLTVNLAGNSSPEFGWQRIG